MNRNRLGAALLLLAAPALGGADTRSYVAGHFFFDLEGVKSGYLESMDGGSIRAEVVSEASDAEYFDSKRLGPARVEIMRIRVAPGSMAPAFWAWVETAFGPQPVRKSGAIVVLDEDHREIARWRFEKGYPVKWEGPALDAEKNEVAIETIEIAHEGLAFEEGDGTKHEKPKDPPRGRWRASDFRVAIGDLPCERVTKVESLAMRQRAAKDTGDARDHLAEPGKLEVPNLKLTFSGVPSEEWWTWHEGFVVGGENGDDDEKEGTLEFTSPSGTAAARLDLHGVGLCGIRPVLAARSIAFEVCLYVERMDLVHEDGGGN